MSISRLKMGFSLNEIISNNIFHSQSNDVFFLESQNKKRVEFYRRLTNEKLFVK